MLSSGHGPRKLAPRGMSTPSLGILGSFSDPTGGSTSMPNLNTALSQEVWSEGRRDRGSLMRFPASSASIALSRSSWAPTSSCPVSLGDSRPSSAHQFKDWKFQG